MNLSTAWIVASKDLKSIRRKKSILFGIILFPLLLAFLFPAVVVFAGRDTGGIPADILPGLLNAFSFFFVIAAATLPTAIASYSIVGEKIEKSLEPILATPTTDGEILLGKSIAAFLPPLLATYASAAIYMALIDYLTYSKLSYLYYPFNWSIGIILLLVIPLAEILSIESSVIASSRVSDVRAANQLGGLMFIPFMIIYLASEIGLITLNDSNLLIISGALLLTDAGLYFFSTATFRREEILTKWK
jgi:ABC-2 type transport system permease protein